MFRKLGWGFWDAAIVVVALACNYAAYCLTGGFRHDEWGYFSASDASIPARLRDLILPLNEHFLPVTKLVQQVIYSFAGSNYLVVATVNLSLAVSAVVLTASWVRSETESRLGALTFSAASILVLLAAFDALSWPGAGLSLFLTAALFSVAVLSALRPVWRIAAIFLMTFSSSAFPAFTAALLIVSLVRLSKNWILRTEWIMIGVATASTFAFFLLRSAFGVASVSLGAISLDGAAGCAFRALEPIPGPLKWLFLALPLIAILWRQLRPPAQRTDLSGALMICGAGFAIFGLGILQIYVGRYLAAGCVVIDSRHLYVPLFGVAMYASGAISVFAKVAGERRLPALSVFVIGALSLLIVSVPVNPTIHKLYGKQFLEERTELGRTQRAFFRDVREMVCATDKAASSQPPFAAIMLPDPSMERCAGSCGLGMQPPFNMEQYGFQLSTYVAYSHSACLSRRFIRFVPTDTFVAAGMPAMAIPKVKSFYDKYFPGEFAPG
jgi:hypothetical protein